MSRPVVLLGLVLLLAATACGGKAPVTHYYTLDVPGYGTADSSIGLDVGVSPFHVAAPYDQDRIVYRIGESSPMR